MRINKLSQRFSFTLINIFRLRLKLTTTVFRLAALLVLVGQTVVWAQSPGSLDMSFGNGGKAITSIGGQFDFTNAVAIQSDGKIVAAGIASTGSNVQFAVVRYIGDAVVPRRTPFDFDGDGEADVSVLRPSNNVWYLLRSSSGFSAVQFGVSTDRIVPADYDGDGKTDVAVYRDGVWYLLRSNSGFTAVAFGVPNDIPVPADYDGDGKIDVAVFRPSEGSWYLLKSTQGFTAVQFGQTNDQPVPNAFFR